MAFVPTSHQSAKTSPHPLAADVPVPPSLDVPSRSGLRACSRSGHYRTVRRLGRSEPICGKACDEPCGIAADVAASPPAYSEWQAKGAALFARPPADRVADASVIDAPATDPSTINASDVIDCGRLPVTAGRRLDVAAPKGRIFQPAPGRFLVVAAG
jgi:hypothetical protein